MAKCNQLIRLPFKGLTSTDVKCLLRGTVVYYSVEDGTWIALINKQLR